MGGRHAFCVAGRFRDRVKATARIHGTALIKQGADSPHLMARAGSGEIYCGHAQRDKYAPADVVEKLDRGFAGAGVRYHYALHRGAEHAYAIPDREVYDDRAANHDWREIFAMFGRQLRARVAGEDRR